MELEQQVLTFLEQTGKPASLRELARRLDLDRDQRRELKDLLRRLIEEGRVVKIRGARVGLPSRMNLIVGRLQCNPGGFGFVVPEKAPAKGTVSTRGGDVYVSAGNLKEALHGDRVVVRVERHTRRGAEGRIIRILERSLTRLVGRYESDGRFGGHVVPFDKRVLHELLIPAGDEQGAHSGDMVSAEITRAPSATRNPGGRVLEVLGPIDAPGVDLKVVMAKYELPDAFPEEVEAEAAGTPKTVSAGDTEGRTDFRAWATVTIDPADARDHDDALSLTRLSNGHFRLGVHIADVAHYVPPGGALDQEAYLRGTSVYFPGRVVPMLPHALSSHICSLVEGEDRLSQSVVLELDRRGKVLKAEFHDGVIRSDAGLSYEQAQAIVEGDTELREHHAALVDLVLDMGELARLMRKQRFARGSLDFDVPDPKLVLGENGEMTAIVPTRRLDSMRLVEEFMLAANEAVAKRLAAAEVGALYRVHEQPDPERVEEFCDLVASFGYRMPQANLEDVRPEDFQLILRQIEGRPEQRFVSYLLLRTMKLARYHEENLGHFGLATRMYAHFTSPIRRYPDLVVHRALRALGAPGTAEPADPENLADMGHHLSAMERRASDAERELIEWKKVRFMADKLGETFSGYITGVQTYGLFIELEEIFVQGLVHVSSMTDDYYQFDEKGHTLKGENTAKAYRLGDKVEVQVVRVDLERRQVDFGLVDVIEHAAARTAGQRPLRAPARGREARARRGHGRPRSGGRGRAPRVPRRR